MTSNDGRMSPWPEAEVDAPAEERGTESALRGGTEYPRLNAAQRLVQDRLSGAALPPEVSKDVTERLLDIADLLAGHQVPERDRHDGWRPDVPGRGHPLLPPYVIDSEDDTTLRGRVTFTRFYLGGNGAVHGGAQPLLFDDVLGRIMNHQLPGVSRTAYLKVDFRQVTPIDVELFFDASRDSVEGRKRWGSARLRDASGTLLAEASGLFVQLLPGQP